MSVCPWCKQTVPPSSGPCPKCGRDPSQHPSIQPPGYGEISSFDDEDSIAVSGQYASTGPSQGRELFDDPSGGPALELDIAPGDWAASSKRCSEPSAASPGIKSLLPAMAPAQAPPLLDPYEIAAFADFGPAPASIAKCPGYAIRVLLRSRELGRMLREAQRQADAAVRHRDDCLAFIAERVRPSLDGDREMSRFLEPLIRCERIAHEREASLANRSQQYASSVAGVDQQIANEETSASNLREKVNTARTAYEARSQELSRAQAQLRRAEIELRNAQELARSAAAPNAKSAPPEHAHKIISAQNQVDGRRRELEQPQIEADAARRALADLERPLSQIEKRIQALRSERQHFEAAFAREAGLRSEGVEQAKLERRLALIQIGVRLFETGSDRVSEEDYQTFDLSRSEVMRCQMAVERILRALACPNRAAVKRGWILIGAGLILGLAVLVVFLVRLPS